MASVMEMPKLSDTMKEGVVGKWLKKEGEKVTAGAPVVEIETDKATMEFESPAGGLLLKILVGDGGTCALNAPIAVIGKEGENWQEALDKYNAKKGGAAAAGPKAGTAGTASAAAPQAPGKTTTAPGKAAAAPSAAAVKSSPAPSTNGDDSRVKASPLAKKIAADKGIDLSGVEGSGPNGRIIQRDVEGLEAKGAAQGNKAARGGAGAGLQLPVFAQGETEKIPLTNMRKVIAERLLESVNTNPHFYLTVSINMGPLLTWRKSMLAKLPEDQKFSVNDLLVFLAARALRKHPGVNSSWQGDHIARYHFVHMAVAVALPTGLITPVVRNADQLTLAQIAASTKDLIKRARDGKLGPDEYKGGTFSISNLGMNGIDEFTAIINPPQAAILAVGATVPTPVVNEKREVVVEDRMKVTLSSDHRVIDGVVGSDFLKTLKTYLEDPAAALFGF